jgi:hypothetical protein
MKHTILLIGIILLLSGCGGEPIIHTDETPFIIGTIEQIERSNGQTLWKYTRRNWQPNFGNFLATERQSVTVDRRLPYAVGDTLRFWCECELK